jgi:hypothetical protein
VHVNRFDSETWVLTVSNKELWLLDDAIFEYTAGENAPDLYELEDALFAAVTELDTVPTAPTTEIPDMQLPQWPEEVWRSGDR